MSGFRARLASALRRLLPVVCVLTAFASPGMSAFFPEPLHLVRRISTPFSSRPQLLEQFCAGERVITVSGPHVCILDYAKQERVDIDHEAHTYSITRFADLALAAETQSLRKLAPSDPWTRERLPASSSQPNAARIASVRTTGQLRRIEVTTSNDVAVSRDALEALLGSSFPGRSTDLSDELIAISREQRRVAQSDNA